ncbi:MAG: NrtA/SsuA/CpmA family ABC transporter substrate-binding protein [Clostridia bacterium]
MKKLICLLLALVLCLCVALAEESDTVTVTYVTSPLNVPTIVEFDQSTFRKHLAALDVGVGYSELTTGPEQTQALASGDIQFLFAVGATSVILSAANGADIRIISLYSRSPKAFRLLSSDAAIAAPADLRGKTIVGPAGTILHELLVSYLASANMTLSDVNFVDMTIPNAMAALTGGSADAALIAGTAAYNLARDGYHVVTTGEGLVDATIAVATSGKFLSERPDVVKAFLAAQREVLTFMEAHPEDTKALVCEKLEMPLEAVEEMYAYYDFSMDITDRDIAGMEKTVRFMLDNGMIDSPVDIPALIAQP